MFATAFKGKKQLVWSQGLRDSLGIERAKTDKEIAEEVASGSTLVCTITPEQWMLILMYKVRGMVLQIAQAEGVQGLWSLLRNCRC